MTLYFFKGNKLICVTMKFDLFTGLNSASFNKDAACLRRM